MRRIVAEVAERGRSLDELLAAETDEGSARGLKRSLCYGTLRWHFRLRRGAGRARHAPAGATATAAARAARGGAVPARLRRDGAARGRVGDGRARRACWASTRPPASSTRCCVASSASRRTILARRRPRPGVAHVAPALVRRGAASRPRRDRHWRCSRRTTSTRRSGCASTALRATSRRSRGRARGRRFRADRAPVRARSAARRARRPTCVRCPVSSRASCRSRTPRPSSRSSCSHRRRRADARRLRGAGRQDLPRPRAHGGAAGVTALDVSAPRIERVRENLERLGLEAETQVADVARVADWWDGRPSTACCSTCRARPPA